MNKEEHIKRHFELHASLDELAADFIQNNHGKLLPETSILTLMRWSHEQTINPVENWHILTKLTN